MNQHTPMPQLAPPPRVQVPLCDLGLAPENLRAAEPEDADVPRLAETIRAAGLLYPPIVRRGRRNEAPFMVLDGRRRRFALQRLAAEGAIGHDHPVECLLAEDRAAQAAGALLPNAEHAPVHAADIILAIGKLRRARLTTTAIAEALGYDEIEVRRLEAMAGVHADVLRAFREGRLSLRQVRLFARLKDKARQGELAQNALAGCFYESALRSQLEGGRVTVEDPRFALVSEADYAAAGGRLRADLFGEMPAEVLDPQQLDALWRTAAEGIGEVLVREGLALGLSRERGYATPEGLAHLPFVHWGALPEATQAALDAARGEIETALDALARAEPSERAAAHAEVLRVRLALARLTAGRGEVAFALLTPVRGGLDATFFQRPPAEASADEDDPEAVDDDLSSERDDGDEAAAEPEAPAVAVETQGVSHAQHGVRTEMATRGLARDLADRPDAAAVALTAHLFAQLLLGPSPLSEAALQVRAAGAARETADDGLDGEVWARLAARREAWRASGLRPIPFVAGLDDEDRGRLLAELTAVTLDLKEPRTTQVRRAARAEALEIARLCDADLSRRWTPDAGFLGVHSRAQLLGFLADMGVELPKANLRKDELVRAVAEAAADRRWLPACLRWPARDPELQAPDPDAGEADPSGEATLDS